MQLSNTLLEGGSLRHHGRVRRAQLLAVVLRLLQQLPPLLIVSRPRHVLRAHRRHLLGALAHLFSSSLELHAHPLRLRAPTLCLDHLALQLRKQLGRGLAAAFLDHAEHLGGRVWPLGRARLRQLRAHELLLLRPHRALFDAELGAHARELEPPHAEQLGLHSEALEITFEGRVPTAHALGPPARRARERLELLSLGGRLGLLRLVKLSGRG